MNRPYRAKSLTGAQTRVRQLMRQISQRDNLLIKFDYERKILAKLAAETPQFLNPICVMEAKKVRDEIISTFNNR